MNILITGGAGFFGDILKRHVLRNGHSCVSIDLHPDGFRHPRCTTIQGDIRDTPMLERLCSQHNFDAVFHCAAILAHVAGDAPLLWSSNVGGTRNVRDVAMKYSVPKIVFTSSNCLWARDMGRHVSEKDEPCPVEVYGKSKWEAEKILLERTDAMDVIIFRCPTIIDSGRLGLLAILFAFIDEGRKVWVVGNGENVYQFIYAPDLADAFLKALDFRGSEVFNIGSDDIPSLKETYEFVIRKAHTGARVARIPRWIAIPLMKLMYVLGLSPLGPYQYRMIAENFAFDTTKIKRVIQWHPTLTNAEMLWKAYQFYHAHRDSFDHSIHVSAHKQPAKMGIIRLVKWFS